MRLDCKVLQTNFYLSFVSLKRVLIEYLDCFILFQIYLY